MASSCPAGPVHLAAGFSGPSLPACIAVVQIVHRIVRSTPTYGARWRALQRVVSTPEFHQWHHADEADAHNANYSIFLFDLWDLLFGIYYE